MKILIALVVQIVLVPACVCAVVVTGNNLTHSTAQISATDEEIKQFVNELRKADSNKISTVPNWQGHVISTGRIDNAPEPLFSNIAPNDVSRPTIQGLKALYDKFYAKVGEREETTEEESRQINTLLDAILDSPVMQKTMEFLRKKNYKASTKESFKNALKTMWFSHYSRAKGQLDTSAFEHVFIGEIKANEVQGMHNWFRVYDLEKTGKLNYTGFIIKRGNVYGMVQFQWQNIWKPTGSFLIGTSPEFEISLYTACFLAKPGYKNCKFSIDDVPLTVTSHAIVQGGKTFIGSIYPTPA